jgi:hypothetical protein
MHAASAADFGSTNSCAAKRNKRTAMSEYDTVTAICRPRPIGKAQIIGNRIVGVAAARKPRATTPATNRTVDAWHSWKGCSPPPDLVREIEEIARHRQCRPRKVLWWLVREALAHRRGRS